MRASSRRPDPVLRRLLTACVIALIGGCASRLAEPGVPVRAPTLTQTTWIAADGAEMPLRRWSPDGPPRAVILALHGFNGYGKSFALPAAHWKGKGIALYAPDQRGFGAAPGRGLWAGTAAYRADARALARLLRQRYPNTPFYLLGESMGGAVAILAVADTDLPIDGLILISPAVWSREVMNPFERAALWLASRIAPGLRLTGEGLERWPSDNIAMLMDRGADPLVLFETRMDTTAGLVDLMSAALDALPGITMPTLALFGANEEILSDEAVAAFHARAPDPVSLETIPTGWHMLLRDLRAPIVWQRIEAWIAATTSPARR